MSACALSIWRTVSSTLAWTSAASAANLLGIRLRGRVAGVARGDLRLERREAAVELLTLLLQVRELVLRRLLLGVGRFLLLVELGDLVGVAGLRPGGAARGAVTAASESAAARR